MTKTFGFRKIACLVPLFVAIYSVPVLAQTTVEPASKVAPGDLHVVVKPGDTLTSIVTRETGLIGLWPEIQAHNKMDSPNSLNPGDIIVIPQEILQLRNFAKVAYFKGDVTLVRKGETTPDTLQKGDKVYLGDAIQTGENGYVSLAFNGDTLVNIQPESRILLQELECFDTEKACLVKLNTSIGQMNIKVNNVGFSERANFTIDTPYASAAVRGTELDIAVSEGNILGVTQGAVDITVENQTINVSSGKGTVAGEGLPIGVLHNLLPKTEFNEFLRISAQDTLSWKPVEGAASYLVAIAGSESMTDIIQSSTEQSTFVPAFSESGGYFINTRAVAKNGLRGFDSIQAVEQAKIDENILAPELDIELIGNNLTIKANGRVATEIHIGDSLVAVDGVETLISYKPYDIEPGKSLELTVDTTEDIYLTARALINKSTVSRYGVLYEFKKIAK